MIIALLAFEDRLHNILFGGISVLHRAVTCYHNINERMREYNIMVLLVALDSVNKFSIVFIFDISLHENKILYNKNI